MPELPEVETVRRGLVRRVKNKRIKTVEVRKASMVRGSAAAFVRQLTGDAFDRIERRGKLLIFHLAKADKYMLVHLKMTGQLILESGKKTSGGGHPWPPVGDGLPNKYSHVIFSFASGAKLYFNDMRQFGYLQIVDEKKLALATAHYGVEPLSKDYTWEAFRESMRGRSVSLKAALLNQTLVAGLGNIYADEVAYRARVRPSRRVPRVTEAEWRRIYREIPKVLAEALKYRGTTFDKFRDSEGKSGDFSSRLKAYGRAGLKCKRCGTIMVKTKVAQRGTTYCPNCQR